MSAPNTNLDTQKRRHIGPILGMLAVVVFAVGLLVWWLADESAEAPGPDPEAAAGTAASADTGAVQQPAQQQPAQGGGSN